MLAKVENLFLIGALAALLYGCAGSGVQVAPTAQPLLSRAAAAEAPEIAPVRHATLGRASGTIEFPLSACNFSVSMPFGSNSLPAGVKLEADAFAYPRRLPQTPPGQTPQWGGIVETPQAVRLPLTFKGSGLHFHIRWSGCTQTGHYFLYAFTSNGRKDWRQVATWNLGPARDGGLSGSSLFQNGYTLNTSDVAFILTYV